MAPLSFRAATYSGVFTLIPMITGRGRGHHREILTVATAMVEAGKLRPLMNAATFNFDSIEAAHALVASGKANGKVVVDIAE
ncbi:zinc-binding dehydrogenase [Leptospira sp. 96542]|nr:zinc-binding dehydrogenase [Leptospira sp. 96542]